MLSGSCLFPLCSWPLLRPLQSLSRLASYTRFMVITTTESLYRPFRRCRSPKKNLYIHTLTCAFLISPLLSRFLLRNPQEASRRLSISSADLSFPFLIFFSLSFSPTSSCPSETAVPVVATISPVTQYAFCLLFSLHPFGLYYILIFLNLFPFSTVCLWPAEI